MTLVYLDHNASTPVSPLVVDAMLPYWTQHYGNASSGHWAGEAPAEALAEARAEVAQLIGATPEEVVFTSGGTESNNFAIKGILLRELRAGRRPHVVISAIEHASVTGPCRYLESLGVRITEVAVDGTGRVDPAAVEAAIDAQTVLVSVMHANNEVGTIQPLAAIADIAKRRGILVHTDAAQSIGKQPVMVDELGVDLLTIAGHKVYAPKGIGALYIRHGCVIDPLVHGAGHEAGRRSGTESIPLAVGLGAACELARRAPDSDRVCATRDHFWARLQQTFGDAVVLNGHPSERLVNTLNVSFVGKRSPEILKRLPEVAASTGAACHYASTSISPVLAKMGVDEQRGLGAIRFSLGRSNTVEEIERVVAMLAEVVHRF